MDLKQKLEELDGQIEHTKQTYRAEMKRLKKARKGIATALEQLNLGL